MVVIYILLILILGLLLWVVFVPVYVRIDTAIDQYELSQAGTIRMLLHPGETPWWSVRVFGFLVPYKRSESEKTEPEKSIPPKKKKSKFKRSAAAWKYMIRGIFRNITLKRFTCTVDVNNVVLNAQLVPVLMLVNRGPVSITTNLCGQYYLHMEVKAQLNKLIWTFIRFLTKK
ncbi:hypothetical protein [Fulvivirga imtechensis]|uniref:hypothetical protein n=1 Tax=Fulvivirga imtechensis TaxID=881893 RepID=UPI00058C0134|nr:hypothetical protein [Fulvivirga imtechensis]